MKKGSLLLTALLTASFLVACENKGGGEQTQQPTEQQTTQQETAPAEQQQATNEEATVNEEGTTEETGAQGEENTTQGEEGATEEGTQAGGEENNTQGENTQTEGEGNTQTEGGENKANANNENANNGGENAAGGEANTGGDITKGKQLFTAKGCNACHQEKADTVGPSLAKIAQAYAGKKEDLIKFLKGEGQAIVDPAKFSVMQPNLAQLKSLSDGDLSALADYILSVK